MRRRLLFGLALFVVLVGGVAALLARDDWNWAKPGVEWIAGRAAGRDVRIEGDLVVDLGRRTDVVASGVLVGNPEWAAIPELASAGRVAFRARLWPLLTGRLVLDRLEADDTRLLLERREDGRGNWAIGRRAGGGAPLALPAQIRLHRFDLALADPKRPRGFRLHVDDLESRPLGGVRLITSSGFYQGEPFALRAALLGLPQKGAGATPAAFEATVGETRAAARGLLGDGTTRDLVHARFAARGPTLDDFWRLAGVPLPDSPPFELAGRIVYGGDSVRLRPFTGRLGKSDLSGGFAVELPRGGRMKIEADVRSHAVDLDDVEGFWGRRPVEETAPSPAQPAGAPNSVFPDLPFYFPKLRAADAEIDFRADRVQGRTLLDNVRLAATLRGGRLELHPLSLGMSRGELTTNATIDATGDTTGLAAEIVVRGIELGELLRRMRIEGRGEGELGARAAITSSGNSLHELARGLDGDVGAVLQNGALSDPLLELLALHLGDYLLARIGKDDDEMPIRCLVGVFDGKDGVLEARRLLLDTRHVRIEGEGRIDLAHERLDLELEQHSKDFSVGALRTPIVVEGPLTQRSARLKGGPLAVRGGAAAALGAMIHPIAALLALIDPGKDDKPGACAQALAELRPIAAGVGERRAKAPARGAAREPGGGRRPR